jgi:predicted TIM-barrel fold metal-dependent hydrolase
MTYAGERRCADADSHLMEGPDWLASFADSSIRDRLPSFSAEIAGAVTAGLAKRPQLGLGELTPEALLHAKGWAAIGALDPGERVHVLDVLGFERQLVFPTFALTQVMSARADDLLYGGIDALNRGMAEVRGADERLVAVGMVSLRDPELALASLERALDLGCGAILIPTYVDGDRSPAHLAHDPIWARIADAGVPIVCHIGVGSGTLRPAWHDNGHPLPRDHVGGGENVRAKDFPSMHHNAEKFLTCLVLDGVFERFPALRCGVIELGAAWVPGFLRTLDAAAQQMGRFEPLLDELTMAPSDYVRRQVKFTPFCFEDVGWLIEQEGDEMFLFSTDFPHPEGGRDPLGKFEASLDAHGASEDVRNRFYAGNFDDLFNGKVPA